MKPKIAILFLILSLLFSTSLTAKEIPSGGEIMIDAIVARPLGLASVGLGLGLFIASSPFSLISGTFIQTGRRLVVYPLKFTFTRGLGDFPGYMEELELVQD
ncbi:MAG: hypothetical protein O9346_07220 [Leptospiraceae bacterium]|jgi:hypothetical protein|nr:hypothetical protein [Leptospiraceae bacterium]MCZ8237374.1 hypothetical protein [Leptospiraceae bacterium]MCZ8346189.1 hypothetical protein [Leptospiraceae bacterium]